MGQTRFRHLGWVKPCEKWFIYRPPTAEATSEDLGPVFRAALEHCVGGNRETPLLNIELKGDRWKKVSCAQDAVCCALTLVEAGPIQRMHVQTLSEARPPEKA